MSALSIQPTYPIFTDIDGQPLEDGYVWIGTANLDPQTNPINVYWDAALTLPAAQPIRTLAGYPANSGTPARLYVNSDYSIRVMNKNGSVVYSAPAATERVSSSLVSFAQYGTGAVATDVQSKLREFVSVKDFGAKGDGVTDDTAAIQAAINSVPTNGGRVYVPAGTYLVSSKLTQTKKVYLYGDGTDIVNANSGATVILKKGTMTTAVIDLSVAGSTVESIQFKGAAGNTGDGVQIRAGRITLRDVFVHAMGSDGIRIGTDSGGENCNLWRLDNVKSKNNGQHGVKISEGSGGLANANGGTAIHCDLQANTSAGLYLGNTQLNTFVGIVAQTNGTYGYHLSVDAKYNQFFGGDPENNTSADIRCDAGSQYNSFYSPTVLNANVSNSTAANNLFILPDLFQTDKGIKFPASQGAASSNANTLDDYAEGTFSETLNIVGTSTAGAGTFTTKYGGYTKIGNLVTIKIALAWTAHTGTGNIKITGLPFTSGSGGAGRSVFSLVLSNITYGAGIPIAWLSDNSDFIMIYLQSSNAALANIALDTAGEIYISGKYQV